MLIASFVSSTLTAFNVIALVAALFIGLGAFFFVGAWVWVVGLDRLARTYDIHRFVTNAARHRARLHEWRESLDEACFKAENRFANHTLSCEECKTATADAGYACHCETGRELENEFLEQCRHLDDLHVCHVLSASKHPAP